MLPPCSLTHACRAKCNCLRACGVPCSAMQCPHATRMRPHARLGQHAREQRVRRDVEGDAQAGVRRPLVQLAGQLAVAHVKLPGGGGGRGNKVHVRLPAPRARPGSRWVRLQGRTQSGPRQRCRRPPRRSCPAGRRHTCAVMWHGGSAMSGSAAGFQAVRMMRRSSGVSLIARTTCDSWSTPWPGSEAGTGRGAGGGGGWG